MNPKKYMVKKIVLDFVLINLVINALFFIMTFKNYRGELTLKVITPDLQFGLAMLGILCSLTGLINLRKDLLRGHVDLQLYRPSRVFRIFPENFMLRVMILTLLTFIIFVPLFSHIPQLLGIRTISHAVGFSIKTLSACLAAALIGYIVLNLTIHDYSSLRTQKGMN